MAYKILKNGSEVNNINIRKMVDQLIEHRLAIDEATQEKFPYRHMSCLLWRVSKYYQKCNHRRKFNEESL